MSARSLADREGTEVAEARDREVRLRFFFEQLEAVCGKQGETDGQRPIVARPLFECITKRAGPRLDLPRQRYQVAGSDRLVRSVRRAVEEQRQSDGLQARHFHGRAGSQCATGRGRWWCRAGDDPRRMSLILSLAARS